jgi:hypothetical protein
MIDINQTARYIIVATLIVTNQQECRGRSPLPGFGARASGRCNSGLPKNSFSFFAAVGGMKETADY